MFNKLGESESEGMCQSRIWHVMYDEGMPQSWHLKMLGKMVLPPKPTEMCVACSTRRNACD